MSIIDIIDEATSALDSDERRGFRTSEAQLCIVGLGLFGTLVNDETLRTVGIVTIILGYTIGRSIAAFGRAIARGAVGRTLSQQVRPDGFAVTGEHRRLTRPQS